MKEMGEKASTKSVKNVQEKIYAEIKKIVKRWKIKLENYKFDNINDYYRHNNTNYK